MNVETPRRKRREFLQESLAFGAAIALIPVGAFQPREASMTEKKLLRWQTHPVARIPNGYQVTVADVNADGKLDILALSHGDKIVEWYENPSWKARPITTEAGGNISLAPLYREPRRVHGLALATDFTLEDSTRGGNIWWAVSPASLDAAWSLQLFGRIPSTHRIRWADLNGDGRLQLVVAPLLGYGAKPPEFNVGAPLTWLEMPEGFPEDRASASSREKTLWPSRLIDDSLTVVHGIDVLDWDGDGRDEILTASFEGVHLLDASGTGTDLRWTKTHLGAGFQAAPPRRGSSEVGVGKVGGRRFVATLEPWHGEQVVVYFEGKSGELWQRHVIDDSLREGHALACADLDNDGNDEIVAGFRGPGTSLYVYYATDPSGTRWQRQTLDTEIAASAAVTADINGDGRPDVVAIGASTGNVKWYQNLG